jgi:D-alanyl-D-alanine carboxypeptidase/D-alanyl-D-alanine-endopeptidase (penicillin-binding protein 4)
VQCGDGGLGQFGRRDLLDKHIRLVRNAVETFLETDAAYSWTAASVAIAKGAGASAECKSLWRTLMTKRLMLLIALIVLVACAFMTDPIQALPSGTTTRGISPHAAATGPADLTTALASIENQPRYAQSDWGYVFMDQKTGEVVASQNPDKMFDPGSTMKTYAVSTALQLYGTDQTFRTPLYRQGTVSGGALNGNLVLVGSGDLSFGLREQQGGSLHYDNLPAIDHSYAGLGVPGAIEPPGDPLAVLDTFAASVKASGITKVKGDVVVDDRLFTPHKYPSGLISPIWMNENLIDIVVTPGSNAGQVTSLNWRPMTASYTVENQMKTVKANGNTSIDVAEPTPGRLVVTGTIAAGTPPRVVVSEISDPSAFARTAFIEALQRTGVQVTARPTGPNPAALLPAKDRYLQSDKLAEHTSATISEYVKLIMKVSYNRGADLMACLSAVKVGSTDCDEGLAAEYRTFTDLGVSNTGAYAFDGAGASDQSRTTPSALATFYRAAAKTSYAQALAGSLPVLGKDGSLGNVLAKSPAAGKAQLKTGNRIVGTPANQLLLLGNSLAGYVQAKSGRQLTIMISVGNVPLEKILDVQTITADLGEMVALLQQSL